MQNGLYGEQIGVIVDVDALVVGIVRDHRRLLVYVDPFNRRHILSEEASIDNQRPTPTLTFFCINRRCAPHL